MGSAHYVFGGSPLMEININGEQYIGPIVRTGSDNSFGFIQQYGSAGTSFGTSSMIGGNVRVKGILSSTTGRGLRCEFESDGSTGGGICIDDQARVYDAIVTR
jgi:formylmethanofuran dehydrogenase subunit C